MTRANELSQMQLDDENLPRVSNRVKPVDGTSISQEQQPSQSHTTQLNSFAIPAARNRSALTDINSNSRRPLAPQQAQTVHNHGLSAHHVPSHNNNNNNQQKPPHQLQSISVPPSASPFFKPNASIPSSAIQSVKSITIKADNSTRANNSEPMSESTEEGDENVNDENQRPAEDTKDDKINANNGDFDENDDIEDENDHFESVMSVIEKTEEERQDENRRMSLKRQAPTDSFDILEDVHTQDTKKPRVDEECNWEDLDAADASDPMMVTEYSDEIFEYYHELELRTLADPNYLYLQKNIRPKMRSILVDWLVEVHMKFRLLPETLFLAINLMDRFLSKELVQVDRLQLLATGALFIAAKFEEVYSPSIKNYAYITDGAYSENDIREAENYMLKALNFDISYPSPYNFLRRISKADNYDINARTIGKYLLEIAIIDHRFIGYVPSLCTAAAMYVARKMVGRNEWDANLVHYSGGYKENDFSKVSEMLMDYLVSPIIHEEFFKKYASKKYFKVSILARQWAKKVIKEGKSIMDPNL